MIGDSLTAYHAPTGLMVWSMGFGSVTPVFLVPQCGTSQSWPAVSGHHFVW